MAVSPGKITVPVRILATIRGQNFQVGEGTIELPVEYPRPDDEGQPATATLTGRLDWAIESDLHMSIREGERSVDVGGTTSTVSTLADPLVTRVEEPGA